MFSTPKGPLLYSDESLKKLINNDSLRYESYNKLIKEYKNSSSKSVYLLNNKYKYRRFIEY
jgi:hypothetical protein